MPLEYKEIKSFLSYLNILKIIGSHIKNFSNINLISFKWRNAEKMGWLADYQFDSVILIDDYGLFTFLKRYEHYNEMHSEQFLQEFQDFIKHFKQYNLHWKKSYLSTLGEFPSIEEMRNVNVNLVLSDSKFIELVDHASRFYKILCDELSSRFFIYLPDTVNIDGILFKSIE